MEQAASAKAANITHSRLVFQVLFMSVHNQLKKQSAGTDGGWSHSKAWQTADYTVLLLGIFES